MSDLSATNPPAPSLRSLVKALVIALGIAVVLLVLVVLPAERNIDITGFGKAIGLTALSAPAPTENAATQPAAQGPAATGTMRDDEAVVDVPPGKGVEYKFHVIAGAKLKYSWKADAGELVYDFHGEPKGAAKDVFESFAAGKATSVKGTLTAPFEGTHGWYWKNKGTKPIKVTLATSGEYEILGIR